MHGFKVGQIFLSDTGQRRVFEIVDTYRGGVVFEVRTSNDYQPMRKAYSYRQANEYIEWEWMVYVEDTRDLAWRSEFAE